MYMTDEEHKNYLISKILKFYSKRIDYIIEHEDLEIFSIDELRIILDNLNGYRLTKEK